MRAVQRILGANRCYRAINVGPFIGYLASWSLGKRWDAARPRRCEQGTRALADRYGFHALKNGIRPGTNVQLMVPHRTDN